MRMSLVGLLICAALGCGRSTHTFDVSVKNDASGPITIGLAKDGPPYESLWASPEEAAIEDPSGERRVWGVVVPPGKTGYAGPIRGTLGRGTRAWLRVYAGEPPLSQVLAIGRTSPNRADVPLVPGSNQITVHNRMGRLVAERAGQPSDETSSDR